MYSRIILPIFLMFIAHIAMSQSLYEVESGIVRFYSDAPLEFTKASSENFQGVLDISKKRFAFRIDIATFMGFNNALQKDHFNENYMESSIYPSATFSGKIIEDVDLQKDGVYKVRAKGKLNIHGVEQERILYVILKVKDGKIEVTSDFIVPLADHNIKIPRVVYDKLAAEIKVSVSIMLVSK